MEQQTDAFIPDGMNAFQRNVKRIGDCLIAFIALIIFSPLFLYCYIAVKREDGGPAIFKQEKAVPTDYGNRSGYWVPSTYGKFINQDRSFHFRLRVWKEGWWKEWTPQIVLGANDVIGDSWNGGSLSKPSELNYGNGFLNRYYLAITKHFYFENVGTLGAHLSWIYSNRFDNKLNNPAMGANFRFHLKDSDSWVHKAINGVNLMAEVVPGYTDVKEDLTFDPDGAKYQVNLGMEYSFWKDYINAIVELNRCKYFSGGLVFKIHLK